MKAPFRGLMAAAVLATSALVPTMAHAQTEAPSEIELSANVAIVTDYRFRGVSLSAGDFAIQGGVDAAHESGFYVGTWMSSLDETGSVYGSTELDLYAGYSTDLTDTLALDVGMLMYVYPDAEGCNCDYFEPYASVSTALGPVEASVGAAYAWDQDSLGGDNLYLYTDLGTGIPNTPLSLSAHLGWTDGVLAPPFLAGEADDTGFDWSVGASATVLGKFDVGVSYIGTEGPNVKYFTDDAIVGTLSASF